MDVAIQVVQVLQQLYEMKETYDANNLECLRLSDRCLVLKGPLETLLSAPKNVQESKREALKVLSSVCDDAILFVIKFSKKSIFRTGTKFFFCNAMTGEFSALNLRINQSIHDLQLGISVDFEQNRQQDLLDLKSGFEKEVAFMIEQISKMHHDQSEQQRKLLELNVDISHSQSEIERLLKERKYKPLSSVDIHGLNQQNASLSASISETHAKIDSLSEKMCTLAILVEAQTLTVSQMKRRTDTLRGLLLSPDDINSRGLNPFAKGSYGQIYSGSFKTAHNKVAIKVIQNKDLSPLTPRQIVSAEGEILLLDGLKYVSVVTSYGYLFDPKKFTIVMELAPFGSLWDLLEDNVTVPSIPFTLCVMWMTTLCDALVFIHSKGVVHKDVKCENLLVFHGLTVKLCDFGLAKHDAVGAQSSLTGAGTDRFMAPEVRLHYHATPASDIYSFAMTALQMLKRMAPNIDNVENQTATALRSQNFGHHGQVGAELFYDVFLLCVQISPNKRPSSEEVSISMSSIVKLLQQSVDNDEDCMNAVAAQVEGKYKKVSSQLMLPISVVTAADVLGVQTNPFQQTDAASGDSACVVSNLVSWMRQHATDVDVVDLKGYAQLMYTHKARTIARLISTVKKDPSFLLDIGIPRLDAQDIYDALIAESMSENTHIDLNSVTMMEKQQLDTQIGLAPLSRELRSQEMELEAERFTAKQTDQLFVEQKSQKAAFIVAAQMTHDNILHIQSEMNLAEEKEEYHQAADLCEDLFIEEKSLMQLLEVLQSTVEVVSIVEEKYVDVVNLRRTKIDKAKVVHENIQHLRGETETAAESEEYEQAAEFAEEIEREEATLAALLDALQIHQSIQIEGAANNAINRVWNFQPWMLCRWRWVILEDGI